MRLLNFFQHKYTLNFVCFDILYLCVVATITHELIHGHYQLNIKKERKKEIKLNKHHHYKTYLSCTC